LRLDENVNWAPLANSKAHSHTAIRLRDAVLTRTQFFAPAHGNPSYLRLTITQDLSEHVLILPFEDERLANAFNSKLLLLVGQTLEAVGSVEVQWLA
jgi:hypothetical protein